MVRVGDRKLCISTPVRHLPTSTIQKPYPSRVRPYVTDGMTELERVWNLVGDVNRKRTRVHRSTSRGRYTQREEGTPRGYRPSRARLDGRPPNPRAPLPVTDDLLPVGQNKTALIKTSLTVVPQGGVLKGTRYSLLTTSSNDQGM